MPSKLNELIVSELADQLKDVPARGCVVISYQELDGEGNVALRRELRRQGLKLKVIRKNLAGIALKQLGAEEVSELFEGPAAVLLGSDEAPTVARTVKELTKKHERLKVYGAYMEGALFRAGEFDRLAAMPGKKELITQIGIGINGPARGIATAMRCVIQKIAIGINAWNDKRQPAPETAPA
ncbi:MAG TPA: 50S ribosomal protein L10 [Candidatus Brocadiia bacterium]|nr:50S ribosomal protein L10 [Candidatus Brocadiia bacterium]